MAGNDVFHAPPSPASGHAIGFGAPVRRPRWESSEVRMLDTRQDWL
jgi:hypothetical protein